VIDLFGGHPDTDPLDDAGDVQLLDTTLRDGEQAPGVSLTADEKASIARQADRAGIAVIEAGSACTGPGERETIRQVTGLDLVRARDEFLSRTGARHRPRSRL
jgi:Isopropylmalate/homocitrate/citramalate synthases